MAMKTHRGSCHCGAVRFEADFDLAAGTNRCNCSICTKARAWFVLVPPERFRLVAGGDAETEYRWTPPGKEGSYLHYRFCKHCGVRTAGFGGVDAPDFYAVPIAALDAVNPEELAAAPIRFADGRHDRFTEQPADTRTL
jgi:hypothetical protein